MKDTPRNEQPRFVMITTNEHHGLSDNGHALVVTLRLATWSDTHDRPEGIGYHEPIDDIRITARFYSDHPTWVDVGKITVSDLTAEENELASIAKEVATLRRKLDKITATAGEPASLAQTAIRFGHITGAQGVIRHHPEKKMWQKFGPDMLAYCINNAIDAFRTKHAAQPAEPVTTAA